MPDVEGLMETMEAYLRRKHEELQLLDACLDHSFAPPTPKSINEAIALKFKLTAAIRAQHDLTEWTTTETAWSHRKKSFDSPFDFRYDYQRADLDVAGPSFYDLGEDIEWETVYTSSGMASISALLLASSHLFDRADIVSLPGTYGETLEFVEAYARHLRSITAVEVLGAPASGASHRILLLDSCASAKDFEACLRSPWAQFDLCIFDNSCLAGSSGKIARALRKARRCGVPMAMIRSHTKLDSLGVEYGRLGSTTFVRSAEADLWVRSPLRNLPDEMRNAVRLLGGAALPAHFPPYVGSPEYRSLTTRRVAAIIRNSRRTAHFFRQALGDLVRQTNFAHGLYVLLKCRRPLDEEEARQAASEMSRDLGLAGFPIRHAGSFGFDFAATEWFHDMTTGAFSVRIAVPDLPTKVWDEQTWAIARWWNEHDCRA
ncbi:hypothetical protein ACVIWU_006383 [Bradyrhizobium sp. USDA 4509]